MHASPLPTGWPKETHFFSLDTGSPAPEEASNQTGYERAEHPPDMPEMDKEMNAEASEDATHGTLAGPFFGRDLKICEMGGGVSTYCGPHEPLAEGKAEMVLGSWMPKFWRWRSVRLNHHITMICHDLFSCRQYVRYGARIGLECFTVLARTSLWLLTAARWSASVWFSILQSCDVLHAP